MKYLSEIEELQIHLDGEINAISAIHNALEGPFEAKSFTPGLFRVYVHLRDESDKLRAIIDKCYEEAGG